MTGTESTELILFRSELDYETVTAPTFGRPLIRSGLAWKGRSHSATWRRRMRQSAGVGLRLGTGIDGWLPVQAKRSSFRVMRNVLTNDSSNELKILAARGGCSWRRSLHHRAPTLGRSCKWRRWFFFVLFFNRNDGDVAHNKVPVAT